MEKEHSSGTEQKDTFSSIGIGRKQNQVQREDPQQKQVMIE